MLERSIRQTHNKYLRDPESAANYINDALESNDPSIILMAIRNVVDAQTEGMASLAEKTKLGRESMYKTLSPNGNPKLATFSAVLSSLGFKLQVVPDDGAGKRS